MEVHHHAHSARKKWTHYFWEFLMLFLAVFCGFLAENFREHKVEDLRAKEFARSLIEDLRNDTAAIHSHQKTVKKYIAICDTLFNLNRAPLEGSNATKFSFYTRFTYWTTRVAWNRTTFDQVKNSGSLRYFKHDLLEDLMKYDALINDIERESFNHETRGNEMVSSINRVIDPQMHKDVSRIFIFGLDTVSQSTINELLSRSTPSLENKRADVNELLNMIVVQQRNLRFGGEKLVQAEQLAASLINEFREVYHLK